MPELLPPGHSRRSGDRLQAQLARDRHVPADPGGEAHPQGHVARLVLLDGLDRNGQGGGAFLLGAGGPKVKGPLALRLFAWSRYAEISADRAGILCAGEIDGVARALFRLASGLATDVVKVDAQALLSQVADMREEIASFKRKEAARRTDWFATHPFS